MRYNGVRYTVATDEDIEHLEGKWAFKYGALVLEGVTGHYETGIVDDLPTDLQDVFRHTTKARIVFRNDDPLGDLFFSDTLPGTTIELHHEDANAAASDVESVNFVELLTGKTLTTKLGESSFIHVQDTQVFYDVIPPTPAFLDYLVDRYPDIRTHMYGASMVELNIDIKSSSLNLRLVSKIPQTLKLPESTAFAKTEVGLVQRQKRHLQDSEFKGLSAFLPGSDLNPFMIFFDQRLRPIVSSHTRHVTAVDGTGSHLVYHTKIVPNTSLTELSSDPRCKLYSEYRLPKEYFFDAFELQKLHPNKTRLFGEQDLEAPRWKVSGWGSILYVDIGDGTDDIQVPFHARYFEPNQRAKAQQTKVMAPQVFQACHLPDEAFADNPWESYTLKSEVFGDDYYFRFLDNRGATSYEIAGALADSDYGQLVMWTTSSVILLGFFYVVIQMLLQQKRQPAIDVHIAEKKGQ